MTESASSSRTKNRYKNRVKFLLLKGIERRNDSTSHRYPSLVRSHVKKHQPISYFHVAIPWSHDSPRSTKKILANNKTVGHTSHDPSSPPTRSFLPTPPAPPPCVLRCRRPTRYCLSKHLAPRRSRLPRPPIHAPCNVAAPPATASPSAEMQGFPECPRLWR